jgi:hypothetical protein
MSNNGRRREPLSTILAGQPLSAQVVCARGTIYGSAGGVAGAIVIDQGGSHAAGGANGSRASRRLVPRVRHPGQTASVKSVRHVNVADGDVPAIVLKGSCEVSVVKDGDRRAAVRRLSHLPMAR